MKPGRRDGELSSRGLAYSVAGTGPPLLVLCGYVVGGSSLASLVDTFASRFSCIVVDHHGSGSSPPSLAALSTRCMARDALAVMDDLGVESAHVYGISLGGMVAQEVALRAPQRVRSLVLGATTAGGISAIPPGMGALLGQMRRVHSGIPGEWRVGFRGALTQAWAAGTHDATDRLDRIVAPTLVIHGEDDRLLPVDNGRKLAESIPQAELLVLPGRGHLFVYDSQDTNHLVLAWLEQRRDLGTPSRAGRAAVADLPKDLLHALQAQMLPNRRLWRSLAAWCPWSSLGCRPGREHRSGGECTR